MDRRPGAPVKSRVSRRDDFLQSKQAYVNFLRAYRKEAGAKSLKDIAKDAARKWRLMSDRARANFLRPEADFHIKCVTCTPKRRKRSCKRKRRRSCRRKRRRSSCRRKRRRSSCRKKRRKSRCKKRRRRRSKPCPCPPPC